MTEQTGSCMCGAVRFTARSIGGFGVCHCEQCRRWTGSALFAATVPETDMVIAGGAVIRTFRSSAWASRAFCGVCGATLWYRFDQGRDGTGNYEVAIGLLDDAGALELEREIFADQQQDCWRLAGDHVRMTQAETLAKYGTQLEND
ncbi:GFA family protein [Salipiger aestuarii]|uniref:GFA family protein n=1 Tax=Salipiger aestuarii TaxID=568098 RepID=UPI001CC29EE7|nr:GFA family protein [Salipiger aestuarii]KAA8611501.1 aldehyde-activating protein [Salipiger aestuarii]